MYLSNLSVLDPYCGFIHIPGLDGCGFATKRKHIFLTRFFPAPSLTVKTFQMGSVYDKIVKIARN